MNWLQKWLVMTRAPVLIMTICAALVGVVLALGQDSFYLDRLIALLTGLTFAHATNNLVNDWVDHRQGVDHDNYFRRQYGVHVLEDRLVSEGLFLAVTVMTGMVAILCAFYLYQVAGEAVLYLTIAGSFFVLFYTWPLKHYGLGELAVLLVWGPMIVCGACFVMGADVTGIVALIALLSGISPTLVIFGKHMDKRNQDAGKAIHTLPVIAGALRSRQICLGLMALQWAMLLLLVIDGNPWLLVCLASTPALFTLCRSLMDEARNPGLTTTRQTSGRSGTPPCHFATHATFILRCWLAWRWPWYQAVFSHRLISRNPRIKTST